MIEDVAKNGTVDWAQLSDEETVSPEEHGKRIVFLAVILLLMLIFFWMENVMHKYKPKVGHETGITILLGICFSLAYFKWHGVNATDYEVFHFRPYVFFDFILPPIIFNSGYNMRRKKFFTNLGNIMITGLGVTFVCFTIYSAATYFVLAKMELTMTRYFNNLDPTHVVPETYPIEIPFMNVLMFTALICSSDVVAAVSIVDFSEQPKLYSCIFGEGIVNDIVSIVLFNTVEHLQETKFTRSTPWLILGEFACLAIVSILIGAAFGFACCLMFKHFYFLTTSVITETFLMTTFGLLAYFTSNGTVILGVEMSGIISMLVFAIIQGHYTWYNLSPQGKATTSVTYEFLGRACEALVYSYVGLSLYSCLPGFWSFELIGWELLIIIVGRIVGVLITFYLFRLCFRKATISFRQLLFIIYGGMIRGAIAFALVL